MELTSCPLCRQQVSPAAKACPACGHPAFLPDTSTWHQFKKQAPPLFFAVVFIASALAAGFLLAGAASIFSTAKTVMHELLAAQIAVCGSVLVLTAIVCAVAISQED